MNAFHSKYFFLFWVVFSIGCSKPEEKESTEVFPEYIKFGRFFTTNCFDSDVCVELFKLQSGLMREDALDAIPQEGVPYEGNFSREISQSDYLQVEALLKNKIPMELLSMPSGMVGNPPEGNFTYFYFEYKSPKQHSYWIIDGSFNGSLGPVLQTFISDLMTAQNIASD